MKSTKNKRMTVVCVLLAMILFSGAIFALVSAPVKADSFSEDDMPSLEKSVLLQRQPRLSRRLRLYRAMFGE